MDRLHTAPSSPQDGSCIQNSVFASNQECTKEAEPTTYQGRLHDLSRTIEANLVLSVS